MSENQTQKLNPNQNPKTKKPRRKGPATKSLQPTDKLLQSVGPTTSEALSAMQKMLAANNTVNAETLALIRKSNNLLVTAAHTRTGKEKDAAYRLNAANFSSANFGSADFSTTKLNPCQNFQDCMQVVSNVLRGATHPPRYGIAKLDDTCIKSLPIERNYTIPATGTGGYTSGDVIVIVSPIVNSFRGIFILSMNPNNGIYKVLDAISAPGDITSAAKDVAVTFFKLGISCTTYIGGTTVATAAPLLDLGVTDGYSPIIGKPGNMSVMCTGMACDSEIMGPGTYELNNFTAAIPLDQVRKTFQDDALNSALVTAPNSSAQGGSTASSANAPDYTRLVFNIKDQNSIDTGGFLGIFNTPTVIPTTPSVLWQFNQSTRYPTHLWFGRFRIRVQNLTLTSNTTKHSVTAQITVVYLLPGGTTVNVSKQASFDMSAIAGTETYSFEIESNGDSSYAVHEGKLISSIQVQLTSSADTSSLAINSVNSPIITLEFYDISNRQPYGFGMIAGLTTGQQLKIKGRSDVTFGASRLSATGFFTSTVTNTNFYNDDVFTDFLNMYEESTENLGKFTSSSFSKFSNVINTIAKTGGKVGAIMDKASDYVPGPYGTAISTVGKSMKKLSNIYSSSFEQGAFMEVDRTDSYSSLKNLATMLSTLVMEDSLKVYDPTFFNSTLRYRLQAPNNNNNYNISRPIASTPTHIPTSSSQSPNVSSQRFIGKCSFHPAPSSLAKPNYFQIRDPSPSTCGSFQCIEYEIGVEEPVTSGKPMLPSQHCDCNICWNIRSTGGVALGTHSASRDINVTDQLIAFSKANIGKTNITKFIYKPQSSGYKKEKDLESIIAEANDLAERIRSSNSNRKQRKSQTWEFATDVGLCTHDFCKAVRASGGCVVRCTADFKPSSSSFQKNFDPTELAKLGPYASNIPNAIKDEKEKDYDLTVYPPSAKTDLTEFSQLHNVKFNLKIVKVPSQPAHLPIFESILSYNDDRLKPPVLITYSAYGKTKTHAENSVCHKACIGLCIRKTPKISREITVPFSPISDSSSSDISSTAQVHKSNFYFPCVTERGKGDFAAVVQLVFGGHSDKGVSEAFRNITMYGPATPDISGRSKSLSELLCNLNYNGMPINPGNYSGEVSNILLIWNEGKVSQAYFDLYPVAEEKNKIEFCKSLDIPLTGNFSHFYTHNKFHQSFVNVFTDDSQVKCYFNPIPSPTGYVGNSYRIAFTTIF